MEYTKNEALFYAICQMRRAARTFDLESTTEGKEYLRDIYAKGLDLCADKCEEAIEPEELKKLMVEVFPK